MRILVAIPLLLLGACSKDSAMPLDVAQSKQMIWDAIKAYHEGCDKGEMDTVKPLLAPEISLVISNDEMIRGYDAVVRVLTDATKKNEVKARSTITGKEVISVTGDVALVTYVASVENQRGIITVVCRRNKDNKWLIAHIHDTWSMPPPKK